MQTHYPRDFLLDIDVWLTWVPQTKDFNLELCSEVRLLINLQVHSFKIKEKNGAICEVPVVQLHILVQNHLLHGDPMGLKQ